MGAYTAELATEPIGDIMNICMYEQYALTPAEGGIGGSDPRVQLYFLVKMSKLFINLFFCYLVHQRTK